MVLLKTVYKIALAKYLKLDIVQNIKAEECRVKNN